MRRALIALSVVGALALAACGSSTEDAATTPTADPAPEGSSSTDAPSTSPSGPSAPDFTLSLGEDGASSFTLSQEAKPVYMVFWAEW